MSLASTGTTRPSRPADAPRKPSGGWYIFAALLFLLSTTAIGSVVYDSVRSFPKGKQFLVPGSVVLTIDRPGEIVVWDEISTFYQGKSYQSSDELPGGIEIAARDRESDEAAVFTPSSGGTESAGSVRRKVIGEVRADAAGTYVIEVTGSFPERVFYVRRSAAGDVCRSAAAVALLGLAGWIVAPVVGLAVLVRRSAAPVSAPIPATAEPTTQPAAGAATARATSADEERTYAMFCHLGGLCGFFVPFASIVVPLILWLARKDSSGFIDRHGREALNFQLSLLIYSILCGVLILVVIGIFLLAGLWLFGLVVMIIAAARAKGGEEYRYPLSIRFIR